MIRITGIFILMVVLTSFGQVDYTTMAINDFRAVVAKFEQTSKYRISYTYSRYNVDQFIESTLGETVRYNNFYYAALDSTVNINTHTRRLQVDHRHKVMTYKYGYQSGGRVSRTESMLNNILSTIEVSDAIDYEDIDLERGKYTFWSTEGNTWKMEYELNKVEHFIEKATFYNYYPDEDFQEVIKIDYQLEEGRIKLKESKYDFNHYIQERPDGVAVSKDFEGYEIQSLKLKAAK